MRASRDGPQAPEDKKPETELLVCQRLARDGWRKRVEIESTDHSHSVLLSTTPETLTGLSVYSRDVVLRENTDQRRCPRSLHR